MSKKPCFLRHFWIFFKLGAILARQTSCCMFSGSWRIFWHPWDPWGRINSGDTRVLRFVFDFFACQRPLADFFHSSQIEASCHFYWFDMNKSDNITFYSHNGWVFKVIQAVSVVIWMDSEQISPVISPHINIPLHTVILSDWTFKKWAHFSFAFQSFQGFIGTLKKKIFSFARGIFEIIPFIHFYQLG